jgi:lipoprotein-releasing system ATP-binding protein
VRLDQIGIIMERHPAAPKLHCIGVTKVIAEQGKRRMILKRIDLEIAPGTTLAILGASGAGKSSLLSVLAGMESPQEGEVYVGDKRLYGLPDNELCKVRNSVFGYVHQFPRLLSDFTASENVAMPLILRGMSKQAALSAAVDALAQVNLAGRIRHRPSELSGGEKQRVALARAIVGDPDFIMADEPTGSLDKDNADRLMDTLMTILAKRPVGIVLVTHDQGVAARMGTLLHLVDGELVLHSKQ